MPIDRSRYPKDWENLSLSVKTRASWHCQHCWRPCRRPDETPQQLIDRIEANHPLWAPDLYADSSYESPDMGLVTIRINKLARFCLTVAHLDQNPANNSSDNLKALCSVCHLEHDRPFKRFNALQKVERLGQLNIFYDLDVERSDGLRVQMNVFYPSQLQGVWVDE